MPRLLSLLFIFSVHCLAAPLPAELQAALAKFHTEGPFGWAFTQTSSDGKEILVESYDPSQTPPFRWSLISKNNQPPSEDELRQYQQNKIVRTSALDAPRLERQLNLDSYELKADTERNLNCGFRLKPGEQHDQAYENLSVLLTIDKPTQTITRVEISSLKPFSPVFGVKIRQSRTVLSYSLPLQDTPSLLQNALITIEGSAFWLKSLDQTLSIQWASHRYTGQRAK